MENPDVQYNDAMMKDEPSNCHHHHHHSTSKWPRVKTQFTVEHTAHGCRRLRNAMQFGCWTEPSSCQNKTSWQDALQECHKSGPDEEYVYQEMLAEWQTYQRVE
jgi:hypothetical protein